MNAKDHMQAAEILLARLPYVDKIEVSGAARDTAQAMGTAALAHIAMARELRKSLRDATRRRGTEERS